jgi:hypothetical protein
MASESVAASATQPESVTVNVVNARKLRNVLSTFGRIPVIENDLFEVRGGIDIDFAVSKANCLAQSIESLAKDPVQGEMSAEVAYLVAFAADTIGALLNSIEGAHMHGKVKS